MQTLVLAGVFLASDVALALDESVSHCVEYYGGAGECPGDDLWNVGLYSYQWFDSFYSLYDYDTVRGWENQYVRQGRLHVGR